MARPLPRRHREWPHYRVSRRLKQLSALARARSARSYRQPPKAGERYTYNGGHFTKYTSGEDSYWLEAKTEGSAQYRFREKSRDETWILLYDGGRNMTLRLPIAGGMCAWSTDGGTTWHPIYRVSASAAP